MKFIQREAFFGGAERLLHVSVRFEMAETAPSDLVQRLIQSSEVEGREHAPMPREYRLTRGERVSGVPGRYLYLFEAVTKIPIKEGSAPELGVGNLRSPAFLANKSGLSIELAVPTDLGAEVPEATLYLEDPGLADAVARRIRSLREGGEGFNSKIASRLFDFTEIDTTPRFEALCPSEGLTEEQQQAATGLSSIEAGFLWGPPGTGKTATLAALAHSAFVANRRTLIVSHTNDAVDALLENLCRRISGRAKLAIPEGSVIRLGPISRSSLCVSFGSQVELESVLARAQEKTAKRLEGLRVDHRRARERISQLETSATLVRSESALQAKLEQLKAKRRVSRPGLFTTLRRVFFGWGNVKEVVVDETVDLEAEIQLVQAGLKKIEVALDGANRSQITSDLADAKTEEPEICAAVLRLEEVLRDVRRGALGNARIVATTATRALLSPEQLSGFDLVVIEEASMLPLPVVYLLAGIAGSQVIVAGDFRQLPPIALSVDPLVKEWYARDIFEASGIVDAIERGQSVPCLFALGTQFRCREEISRLFNAAFYGGTLRSSYEARLALDFRGELAPLSGHPVVVVDTSNLEPRGVTVSRSKANLVHAALVREIRRGLSSQKAPLEDSSIGILAPYRPQVVLLRELINEEGGHDVAVGTVHRFQGSERPVILLDLTESAPHRLGNFLGAVSRRDAGARLLNVALSRAQELLVIVADLSHLRSSLTPSHILSGVLAEVESQGGVVDAADLLRVPNDASERPSFELHTRAMFLSALIEDLRRASGSCLMVSPVLSIALVKVVANAVATRPEGLAWRVVVPPYREGVSPSRDEYETSLDLIAQVGGEIEYSHEVVQPLVVLDQSWVWTGSLSPLSCLESDSGAMVRLSGKAAVEAARQLLVPLSSVFPPAEAVGNS